MTAAKNCGKGWAAAPYPSGAWAELVSMARAVWKLFRVERDMIRQQSRAKQEQSMCYGQSMRRNPCSSRVLWDMMRDHWPTGTLLTMPKWYLALWNTKRDIITSCTIIGNILTRGGFLDIKIPRTLLKKLQENKVMIMKKHKKMHRGRTETILIYKSLRISRMVTSWEQEKISGYHINSFWKKMLDVKLLGK